MKAHVGDRLVVEGTRQGDPRRIGVITALRRADGSPPYLVRWLDGENEVLVFPGPDAHIEHPDHDQASDTAQQPDTPALGVKEWNVRIFISEQEDKTSARAVLSTPDKTRLEAVGHARRNPSDRLVPEIGDELATARALSKLSDALFAVTSQDIEQVTGQPPNTLRNRLTT